MTDASNSAVGASIPSLPPRGATSASSGATTALREGLVANAVQFLQHPNVVGTPLARKIAFLKRKNLTNSEIDAALRQAAAAASETGLKKSSSSVVVTVPSTESRATTETPFWSSWKGAVCTAIIAAGVGCAAAFAYDSYIKPWIQKRRAAAANSDDDEDGGFGDDDDGNNKTTRELLEDVRRNQVELMKSIADLTAAVQSQSHDVHPSRQHP